jgi:PTS system cellobiose-specific IIA component
MEDEVNTKGQQIAMTIIAYSGQAKGLAFDALKIARDQGDVVKARQMLEEAGKAANEAHKAQTELLTLTANGVDIPVDVLLVHSQDHLMTTMIAIELITEMITMFEKK